MKQDTHNSRNNVGVYIIVAGIAVLCVVLILIGGYVLQKNSQAETQTVNAVLQTDVESDIENSGDEPDVPDPVDPAPPAYTEATILSAGDIIIHSPQLNYAKAAGSDEGIYDFSNTFQHIRELASSVDYAVVNLETTLSSADAKYSGYPTFNSPDSLLDSIQDAGFDMMLFANNHCYDRNLSGLLRTQEQIQAHGLSWIGAKLQPEDDSYTVVEINGIRVGMFNYSDDMSWGKTSQRTINGIRLQDGALDYMNLFNLSLLDEFYDEVDTIIGKMREAEVDIIIAYMHWGQEYHTEHDANQGAIAQALCDRGVDVIIGGHPHVIQDVEVLTDQAGTGHQTLCYYSLGNLVSNQNRRTMTNISASKYTEGGLMVLLTLRRYENGEVVIVSAENIPTFTHRYAAGNGCIAHEIVPLEKALAEPAVYNLTASNFGESDAAEIFDWEKVLLGDIVDVFNNSVKLPKE